MYSILIVDDEPLVAEGIRIILENSCIHLGEIREAENGEEALSLIIQKNPDILITDIRMPKMDGLELCRKINRKCPRTSIIIVSGYDDFKYAQEAIKYGVKQYLLKPVQKNELIKTISETICEKESNDKIHYVAYKELDEVINKFENGLWNNLRDDVEEGINQLNRLLGKTPIEYCIKIAEDLGEMLLNKLSLKIGYTLKVTFPLLHEYSKDNFFIWINEILEKLSCELKERRENIDFNLFEMAKQYIKDNYNREITLDELARKTGFSTNYFSQLFKMKTGKNFVQYRSEIRITKAMEMLCSNTKSITEIAMDVGFNDVSYFIRAFKEYAGLTPSEFKRKRGIIS